MNVQGPLSHHAERSTHSVETSCHRQAPLPVQRIGPLRDAHLDSRPPLGTQGSWAIPVGAKLGVNELANGEEPPSAGATATRSDPL